MKILGIGSRLKHSEYGVGVVTNVTAKHYWVTFIENGLETIDIDSEFEVIEAVEGEVDTVSFYEVEKTLKNLLQKHFLVILIEILIYLSTDVTIIQIPQFSK